MRLRRLQADYEKLRAFLAQQPRIRLIQAQGTPPERYQLEFQIKGLREVDEQLQTVANHIVEISLPLSYPRLPPQCRMLTPVFHPNIAPHAICIGDHWSAGEPLWSMVARIGEMIAYQSYNTKSPLNGEAARWVEANQHRLPLDRTNFVMDDARPPPAAAPAPLRGLFPSPGWRHVGGTLIRRPSVQRWKSRRRRSHRRRRFPRLSCRRWKAVPSCRRRLPLPRSPLRKCHSPSLLPHPLHKCPARSPLPAPRFRPLHAEHRHRVRPVPVSLFGSGGRRGKEGSL